MIYKSYIIEQNLKSISNHKSFLFYGENQGLKKELKEKIRLENKDKEILNIFQEDLIKNKNLLENEISNKSLFEKKKIFFVNEVNDKIFNIIEQIIEKLDDEKIYIFSDMLDKRSKLRNIFEKSKDIGIAACYPDNEITIKKLITQKLGKFKGFSSQILNLVIHSTGLDRDKINNELDKIISCFYNKEIEVDKVEQLINTKASDDFFELKDEAINGNKNKTNKLLAETVLDSEKYIYYLNIIIHRIIKLREIQVFKLTDNNLENIVAKLKPPVFWKDKPILIEQSKKWDENKIRKALKMMLEIEGKIKTGSTIRNDLLFKNLIIDLCLVANSSLTVQK